MTTEYLRFGFLAVPSDWPILEPVPRYLPSSCCFWARIISCTDLELNVANGIEDILNSEMVEIAAVRKDTMNTCSIRAVAEGLGLGYCLTLHSGEHSLS